MSRSDRSSGPFGLINSLKSPEPASFSLSKVALVDMAVVGFWQVKSVSRSLC